MPKPSSRKNAAVSLSGVTLAAVDHEARYRGCSREQALAELVRVAVGRLGALRRNRPPRRKVQRPLRGVQS